jgi:hypothetical protein
METIFNKNTRDRLISRVHNLSGTAKAAWGKMDSFQMLRHCVMSEEMFLGKKKYDRLFIGKLFGKMALKAILKNDQPLKKNQPTHPDLKIKGWGNIEAEKQKWIALLKEYEDYAVHDFVHPFFGKMSREQIGYYVYKHTDHHLRQFSC